MVKGLIVTQASITQDLRRDMDEVKQRLGQVDTRLDRMGLLITQIFAHLPEQP
jgi:hypothetical protein